LSLSATEIGSGVNSFKASQAVDRNKAAELLDLIAKDVRSVSTSIKTGVKPNAACAALVAHSAQVPPLLGRVYQEGVAEEIGQTLKLVYDEKPLMQAFGDDAKTVIAAMKRGRYGAIAE
jgi:hypothetical protein